MKIKFTKMHGAGNDFVVLDCTKEPFSLTSQQLRFLADRHFGVGADQILVVEPADAKPTLSIVFLTPTEEKLNNAETVPAVS